MRIRYGFTRSTRERLMRVRRMLRAGHTPEHVAAVLGTTLKLARRYVWLARQKGTGLSGNPGGTS